MNQDLGIKNAKTAEKGGFCLEFDITLFTRIIKS